MRGEAEHEPGEKGCPPGELNDYRPEGGPEFVQTAGQQRCTPASLIFRHLWFYRGSI